MIKLISILFVLIISMSYGKEYNLSEKKEAQLVKNFDDICAFAKKYPNSKYSDTVIKKIYSNLDVVELKVLNDFYPNNTILETEINRLIVAIIPDLNLEELLQLKSIFSKYESCKKIDKRTIELKKEKRMAIKKILNKYKEKDLKICRTVIEEEIAKEFDDYFQNGIGSYLEDVYSFSNKFNTLRNKFAFWDNIRDFKEEEKIRVMWNKNFDSEKLNIVIQEIAEYINKENKSNRNKMIFELMDITEIEINDNYINKENNEKNYNGAIRININNSALNQEICSIGLSGVFGGFMAITIPASGPLAPLTAVVETAVGIGIDIITTKMSMKKARKNLTASFKHNKEEYINCFRNEYNKKVENYYIEIEKKLVKNIK